MIYLDNSATTRIDDDVIEAMLPWLTDDYGNASSIYSIGRKARVAIEDARSEIAALLNAHPAEIIFTSGGTEANNAILKSSIDESDLVDSIVVSSTEHHSILHPARELQRRGHKIHEVSVDAAGIVDVAELSAYNTPKTFISVMTVNNETGTIQPLHEIRSAAPLSLLHTDAVQAFGKLDFDVAANGVDFATISAHKIHGPKGVGAMYIRKGIDFKAHQQGGAQERNRRAGTESTALIVGFQVAARKAIGSLHKNAQKMHELTSHLITLLKREIPGIRVNTPDVLRAPHIVNISFVDAETLDGEAVLQAMDIKGIAVSNGSACVSGSLQPSHVLVAMGLSVAESKAAVRFSVCKDTTVKEVDTAVTILAEVARSMRN
ncbi:MAG: cysteine desulfurase [Ignavibacteria bacterium]|nr:cysteine desulfurase [Ignavibacteria bacterium]